MQLTDAFSALFVFLGAAEYHFALMVAYTIICFTLPSAEKNLGFISPYSGIIVHLITYVGISYDRGDLKYHRRSFYRFMGLFESSGWFALLLKQIKEMSANHEDGTEIYCLYLTDALVTLSMIVSSMYAMFLVQLNSNSFIQQEFKIYASRTYNELEKVDYLEANYYCLCELAKNICPFLLTHDLIQSDITPETEFIVPFLQRLSILQAINVVAFTVFFLV